MRLIDADKLKRKAQRVATEAWKTGYKARIETIVNQFIDWIEQAPTVEQPESCEDKLKEIADSLSEKMCYMNTCLNEREIILGYLGVKRSGKDHCNTDCRYEKCESYRYATRKPPEPCEDADDPVICAECRDTGVIKHFKDGDFLTCGLADGRIIYNSKPAWCPKTKEKKR